MLLAALALLTTAATLAGGWLASTQQRRLRYLLGFTAGVLLGVVAFDVLPEIFELTRKLEIDPAWPMIALVAGFLGFHVLEKLAVIHHDHEDSYAEHHHPDIGSLSALAIIGHSFTDGLAIGLALQVGTAVGVSVAIAVIAHKFVDGLSLVSLMLAHHSARPRIRLLLLLGAIAPLLGAALTTLVMVPVEILLLTLGLFAGFLLYISAGDILPQAHRNPSRLTIVMTLLGVGLIFAVSRAGL